MGDIYSGLNPVEYIVDAGRSINGGLTETRARLDGEAKRKAPAHPVLQAIYADLAKGLQDPLEAPQVAPPAAPPSTATPTLSGFTPPQQSVPDVSMSGVSRPGSVSPSGGPDGPMGSGAAKPSSGGSLGMKQPEKPLHPNAPPGASNHEHVNNILYGDHGSIPSGAGNAQAAPDPAGRPQMATAMVQPKAAPVPTPTAAAPQPQSKPQLQSTSGRPPRELTNEDISMMQPLLPLAAAKVAAKQRLATTGITESGKNARAGLSQTVKSNIAQLKANTSTAELGAKIERDLELGAEKLDVQQQEAYLRAMTELEKARMALSGSMYATDGRVKAAGMKKDGADEALKYVTTIFRYAAQGNVNLLPGGREAVKQALAEGARRWPDVPYFKNQVPGSGDSAATSQDISNVSNWFDNLKK